MNSEGESNNVTTSAEEVSAPNQNKTDRLNKQDKSEPNYVSTRSDRSVSVPINFKDGDDAAQQKVIKPDQPEPNYVSTRSDRSASVPINFKDWDDAAQQNLDDHSGDTSKYKDPKAHVEAALDVLKKDMIAFVSSELTRFKKSMFTESPGNCNEDKRLVDEEERRNREAILKIATSFLIKKNERELADFLQRGTAAGICQQKLRSNLKRKNEYLCEGIYDEGRPKLMNQVYTELNLTGSKGAEEVWDQDEVQQMQVGEEALFPADFFKCAPGRERFHRVLVTKGMSGIGKTVLTQKFTLDWAERKNPKIQFVFPVTFRELNLLNVKKTFSLVELIHHLFNETKEAGIRNFEDFQVLFIFDGLDECRPPLDFNNTQILTDVTESGSVHTLLINLIRGDLLPSARLWITTRPAAANQIPAECVDMVTEVRGFTDQQQEEYFRKRFSDEDRTRAIVSHIEGSRSLHMMCYIPIFCWITATVLDYDIEQKELAELPRTLTEMYIHFLLVQVKQNSMKYQKNTETTPISKPETEKCLLALGKLAFEQLEKGNLIFTEKDLEEYNIYTEASTIFSGLFTEVSQHKVGLNQEKVFSFIHLSFQEFLAALYVSVTFTQRGINLLRKRNLSVTQTSKYMQFYRSAVDSALQSSNGHMDMFVRFLLGLSLDTNQNLLQRLNIKAKDQPRVKNRLVKYIRKKIKDSPSVEKSIHLFYWLNELDDHSLQQEIQQYLSSENVSDKKLTLSQWSTLAFILLSSQKDLNVFELKKFYSSKEALLQLLPVVKASQKSLLSSCGLSWKSCIYLLPALTSDNSSLRELDLSDNDLRDTGAQTLSGGLKNPHCRLEVLRLSGCMIDETGCCSLAFALTTNPTHLKELDLSFNHPGETGTHLLTARLRNSNWRLEILNLDHCGKARLQQSPLRYFRQLSLDVKTANQNLGLSPDKKKVVVLKEEQSYPDFSERFEIWKQILCSDGLTGRCYWEVRWTGSVRLGVAYRGIRRKGNSNECCLGWNNQSWSLFCSRQRFTAWHDNKPTFLETVADTSSDRLAVYLDWSAGIVSFYLLPQVVSSMKRIHLHTFQSTFTEPLYPAFGFGYCDIDNASLSVTLTSFEENLD